VCQLGQHIVLAGQASRVGLLRPGRGVGRCGNRAGHRRRGRVGWFDDGVAARIRLLRRCRSKRRASPSPPDSNRSRHDHGEKRAPRQPSCSYGIQKLAEQPFDAANVSMRGRSAAAETNDQPQARQSRCSTRCRGWWRNSPDRCRPPPPRRACRPGETRHTPLASWGSRAARASGCRASTRRPSRRCAAG
jgi:hypothetical protein